MSSFKRVLICLLVALVLVSYYPARSFADSTDVPGGDVQSAAPAENTSEPPAGATPAPPAEKITAEIQSEQPAAGFAISGAEIDGDQAAVTYRAEGTAVITVTLIDEDDADENVLASGSLNVSGNGEEETATVTVAPAGDSAMPEHYILKAVLTDPDTGSESEPFFNTAHTRKTEGISEEGLDYFDYLPGDHKWDTGSGYIAYAATAVVLSEEESLATDCVTEGDTVRIAPIPTEIRNMTEEERAGITSIVFAVGEATEHRIIRTVPGTMAVFPEDDYLTVRTDTPVLSAAAPVKADSSKLVGVYDSIRLTAPANAPSRRITVDEPNAKGELIVEATGEAQYNWNFYVVYFDEELFYDLNYTIDYDLALNKTTDYVPSGLDDENLYDELNQNCLEIEIPDPVMIDIEFSNYMISLLSMKIPNYLHVKAAANSDTTASGTLKTDIHMMLYANMLLTNARKMDITTDSTVHSMDTAADESVFWICDTTESFFEAGTTDNALFSLHAESGDCISSLRNDVEFTDAADKAGETVKDGRIHYCGTAPLPNNYCTSLSQKKYYKYDYKARLGVYLKAVDSDDNWSRVKTDYSYISKAYGEEKTGTKKSGAIDLCEHYGYRIHVKVYDNSGRPAAGATVTAVGHEVLPREERFRTAVTDANGEADIYAPSGIWNVQARDEEGGNIGAAQADITGHPASVVINDNVTYIETARVTMPIPQQTGDSLPGTYGAAAAGTSPGSYSLWATLSDWRNRTGSTVDTAVDGAQFVEITLEPNVHWTQGRVAFSDDLRVDVLNESSVSMYNCQVVYVKVSDDGQTARVMVRVDTFPKGAEHYSVTVGNGWGSGEYRPGDTVLIASYDLSEYGDDLHIIDFAEKMIRDTVPEGWTGKFLKWRVLHGDLTYSADFTPVLEGKYSICSFTMPGEPVVIESVYKPDISEIDVAMPVPGTEGIDLPQRNFEIEVSTPQEATLLCDDNAWLDADGEPILQSVYGDQYLTMKVTAIDEQGGSLLFTDEPVISITDSGTGGNEKYRLVGYKVSEDKLSVDMTILVHISRPGAKEYELTVNNGFLSGWYEAGTLVPIISYDIPFLRDKLEDYLGKWALVIKEILPPSWQKSFSSWRVDSPTDGSVAYKKDFTPIITKDGTTYAAAFFRMPACDTELTAEYEGLTEIKDVTVNFDVPEPGEYMDYFADCSTEGVKSGIPYVDKLKLFPMMWSTIFEAEYNESYTAFIPVSPKDGYKFGWPLGLTTTAHVPDPSGKGSTEADFFIAVGDYALITHTYKTPKAQLLRVTNPAPVYFDNGTPSSEINDYLQSVTTKIVTEEGMANAKVKWNTVADTGADETGRFTYDSTLTTRQEVEDTSDGSYTLKGTMILPANIRNTEEDNHSVVDQTVEIKVIIKDQSEEELYPPTAMPPAGIWGESIDVTLSSDSRNPAGTQIWYLDAVGRKTQYTGPINLPQRDEDTTYVIETWAEKDGVTSPTVSYVYTIRGTDGPYRLSVTGGTIENAGEDSCTEATFEAGTQVTIKAAPSNSYEHFDHWEFSFSDAKPTEETYSFKMPAENAQAIAVFAPNTDDELIISNVILHMEELQEGAALPEQVTDSLFQNDKFLDVSKRYELTADPQPEIRWNVPEGTIAARDTTYTAAIPLDVRQLQLDETMPDPDHIYFSESLLGTVNGHPAKVILDPSRKYATLVVTFEVYKTYYTVEYDANGGQADTAPAAQQKTPEEPLTITRDEPVRDGYVFRGWSSQKNGGVEYEPGDKYTKDEDTVLYAVWEKCDEIRQIEVAFDVPDDAGDLLPPAREIKLNVLDPKGAPVSLGDSSWKDDFGLGILTAETGDQYLFLTVRENDPRYSLSEDLDAVVKDTSFGGNDKVTVESVTVSDDGKEAQIVIQVHISKPGVKEYYLSVEDGIGDGYYEEGETVLAISYDIKSISTVLKELLPGYKTLISLAEYFAEKLTGTFEKWEVLDPTDGTLEYKTDFWPVVLKSGKTPKVTYAATFFSMPAHDVELKAVYGSPETIDSVTMNFPVPKIGEPLAELADCTDPKDGVKPVPFMGKDGRFKISWSGPDTVRYNEEYTAKVYVTAESGYKLKEILGIVTVDSYFPKGYDCDSGTQPAGYAEGSTLGFMDYAILSYTYKTPKAQLLSLQQPNTVYFPNGTDAETINAYLRDLEIAIMTEDGQKSAKANWSEVVDTAAGADGRFTYDSSLAARQEVLDENTGTYKVSGTLRLPGEIRNTATKTHEKVDQNVEITVVILDRDSTELLPPAADPDSCESDTALEVALINDERNPDGTEIVYTLSENGTAGEETLYTDKILLAQKGTDTRYVIEARARNGAAESEAVTFTYLVKAAESPRYTVTVIGGTVDLAGTQKPQADFEPGEEVTVKAAPDEQYEVFDHWEFDSLNGLLTDESYTFTMPAHDVTATAVYKSLPGGMLVDFAAITIEEPAAGKALTDTVTKSAYTDTDGRDLTALPEPAVNWNTGNHEQAEEGKTYTASIVVNVADLQLNGESLPDSAVLSGSFTATVNGKEARVILSDSRKYAIVEADFSLPVTKYTVTYDANGGDGTSVPAPQTKEAGKPLTLSDQIPTRSGYQFAGWSTDPDTDGIAYDPADTYEQDADITLYAVWKPEYTVTAGASSGGTAYPAEQKVAEGGNARILFAPIIQPASVWKLNKVVLYDTDPASGQDITDRLNGSTLRLQNVQKDMNVYAFFVLCPHTVTAAVTEGRGTVSPASAHVEDGGSIDLTITPDEGFALDEVLQWVWINGQRVETDVTDQVSGGILSLTDITQNTYADVLFKELEYTVSYDANGGSDAPAPQIKKYHSALTISDQLPVRDGYRFLGWSTDSDADTPDYQPGGLFTVNEDTSLFAVWVKTYNVTAECPEGGTVDPAEQAVAAGENGLLKIIPEDQWSVSKVLVWFGDTAEPVDMTDRLQNGELLFENVTSDIHVKVECKKEGGDDPDDPGDDPDDPGDDPDDPGDDPDDPGDNPDDPGSDPDDPGSDTPDPNGSGDNDPDTGDSAPYGLMLLLCVVSLLTAGAVYAPRRRNKTRKAGKTE